MKKLFFGLIILFSQQLSCITERHKALGCLGVSVITLCVGIQQTKSMYDIERKQHQFLTGCTSDDCKIHNCHENNSIRTTEKLILNFNDKPFTVCKQDLEAEMQIRKEGIIKTNDRIDAIQTDPRHKILYLRFTAAFDFLEQKKIEDCNLLRDHHLPSALKTTSKNRVTDSLQKLTNTIKDTFTSALEQKTYIRYLCLLTSLSCLGFAGYYYCKRSCLAICRLALYNDYTRTLNMSECK